jgi:serine protease AprX
MTVFDSLRNDLRLKGTLNFVGGGLWVYQGTSHGSNVLSTMASNSPGLMIGTAPLADYWLIRTEDVSGETLLEEYNWVSGAEYADSAGADIISSSLAYRTFGNPATDPTFSEADGNTAPITIAADIAASKGIIVVTSAGNYAQDWNWPHIGFPADADSVLTVGAVDVFGAYAPFSSFGPTSDGRLKPDVVARGVATFVADPTSGFANVDGTSFSTPIVAGLLACLKGAFPQKTNMELFNAVRASSSHSGLPDTLTGYGVPDFSTAFQLLTGIQNSVLSDDKISVFPNPCSSSMTVIFHENAPTSSSLEIFDLQGRRICIRESLPLNGNRIELSNEINKLNPGTYLLKIAGPKGVFHKTIIKL